MGRLESFRFQLKISIHDDISLMLLVIPGLTEPAPYLIRGNPVLLRVVFSFQKRGGWGILRLMHFVVDSQSEPNLDMTPGFRYLHDKV
jgi:hypothetical protein